MGGAGFPTGRKWDLVAAQPARPKYVDLQRRRVRARHLQGPADPGRAAAPGARGPAARAWLVVGAEQGWVFIRHEYGPEEDVLRAEIEALRARRADRGRRPAAPGDGSRSRCSSRPAATSSARRRRCSSAWRATAASRATSRRSPACYGLWGQPTLINSVETFADVPVIVSRGAAVVAGPGRRRLGRAEVLRGLRARRAARRLLRADGHHGAGAARPGRRRVRRRGRWPRCSPAVRRRTSSAPTSSTCRWTSAPWPRPAPMLGSGALVVIAEGTDLLAAATNVLRFFRDESCGKCVPCRVGSTKAHALLASAAGRAAGSTTPARRRSLELEQTHAQDLDLRAGPGRARPGGQRRWTGGAGRDGSESDGALTRPVAAAREFFTARTVAEARAGFRPARRTPARDGAAGGGAAPGAGRGGHRRRPRCPASPGPPWTASRCGPPTPTARPTGCPSTSTCSAPCGWARRRTSTVGPGTAAAMPTGGVLPDGRGRGRHGRVHRRRRCPARSR